MNWTKIPTNLLIDRTPDNEMIAIVKYQLLWAELEYQPTDETALRYMTSKQLALVKHWLNTIETQVVADIKSANTNRTKRKLNYTKNKGLKEIVTDTLHDTVTNTITNTVSHKDKIKLNKNKLDNIINNIGKENTNSILIDSNFSCSKFDVFKVYIQNMPAEIIKSVESWIKKEKNGQTVPVGFITKQFINFARRQNKPLFKGE